MWRWISEKNGNMTSVRFDPRTSSVRLWRIKHWVTQSALTGTWSANIFCSFVKDRSPHWNQVHFDHPHENRVNFDAHNKTKRFAVRIQKKCQFRPLIQKTSQSITTLKQKSISVRTPSISTTRTENKAISIHHTKIKSNWMPRLKSAQLDPHSKITRYRCPDTKTK